MSEWREIAEWDWVWHHAADGETGTDDLLHAVAEITNDCDEDWLGVGATECGLKGTLTIPGILERMSVRRCAKCCDILGMPHGDQSPKNVDECRPFVEARLQRLREGSVLE